jgi:putative toxin-antitoxin system antitoxin component (TIGR02293 family)
VTYICATNDVFMEKKIPPKKIKPYAQGSKVSKAEEPEAIYNRTVKIIPSVKDFTYNEFKKIADKVPFTQAEWASILHVSERTLQRYAKNNGSFAPINADRALQIANVINEGKITFGKTELFYNWLKRKPLMLEGPLSFDSLTTTHGIQMVLTQLGRIQHGILA